MPIYMDDAGKLYSSPTPLGRSHAVKPFASAEVMQLLEGEAPQSVDNLTEILTAQRDDPTTIPRLKALSKAARGEKE